NDLNGQKMRVPNVPLFVDVWKALGANPGPMAFSEVFTSLQNGTIDSQENPLALIRSANFNEVQSHVNMTQHVRSWIYLTIAESTWSKLSSEDQGAVMQAAALAQAYERGLFEASIDADRAYLESKGMTFVEVDGAAYAAKAKDAVLANVNAEIKPIVEGLFAN
ncbi:MAG: TRAP transporter substrate-binding protein, partial [Tateyamaria sp.]|nr:TRAP transporter substrate-binding protein [Tateyamaria sp.]